MKRVCNWKCFRCSHPDCINDSPPSIRETAIIEADDRYVKWMQLTDAQKRRRLVWRAHNKKRRENLHERQRAESADHRSGL